MKKLIRGIIQFHETRREGFAETFKKLALGQKPDALFIACSDSRMAVNVFASTDPGDLFVLRNVGNLVPPYGHPGGTGTSAAIDFAVNTLQVRDIIVCGHSDCGAMSANSKERGAMPQGPLKDWLDIAAEQVEKGCDANNASQRNVLAQLEHLLGYPCVATAITERGMGLHGLWFDIQNLNVMYYEQTINEWTVVDKTEGERIIKRLEK